MPNEKTAPHPYGEGTRAYFESSWLTHFSEKLERIAVALETLSATVAIVSRSDGFHAAVIRTDGWIENPERSA
jgi:hypothetical protein